MKCDEKLGVPDNDSLYQIHDWRGYNSNPKGSVEFSISISIVKNIFMFAFRDS